MYDHQEVFEILAEFEQMMFYEWTHNPTEENKRYHEKAKELLEKFAKVTGCHN